MRGYGDPQFGPISDQFDRWLVDAVTAPKAEREQALANWASAPGARLSHPPRAEEHLLPLMVAAGAAGNDSGERSEEHTSELQSLMRISYAVFCLKKKK